MKRGDGSKGSEIIPNISGVAVVRNDPPLFSRVRIAKRWGGGGGWGPSGHESPEA